LGIVWDLRAPPLNLASVPGIATANESLEPAANIGA